MKAPPARGMSPLFEMPGTASGRAAGALGVVGTGADLYFVGKYGPCVMIAEPLLPPSCRPGLNNMTS